MSLDGTQRLGAEFRHNTARNGSLEVPDDCPFPALSSVPNPGLAIRAPIPSTFTILTFLLLVPALALAQSGGTPFDTGFTALQNLFTGTIAKVASLIAIVIGGYQFAHGEPGAKKTLAGVAAGTGVAVMAVNVLNWLWGI